MNTGRHALAWIGLTMGVATAGAVATNQLPALAKLQPGQWQMKEIGAEGMRSVCLTDPAQVLQIGHGDAQCSRSVLDSAPGVLTVRYVCAGKGHGRSTLTFRSPGSFRLQTQGLADGSPFDLDYDARRVGDCAPPAAPAIR